MLMEKVGVDEEAPAQNNIAKKPMFWCSVQVVVLVDYWPTLLNKAAAEYNVLSAAAGGYAVLTREMLPEFDLVILAPQVASNFEDSEGRKLINWGLSRLRLKGAQYIKLTRDGKGALAFVQEHQ